MMFKLLSSISVVLVMFAISGCSKSMPESATDVDTAKSVAIAKQEASEMSYQMLQKTIANYSTELNLQSEKLKEVSMQFQQIPAQDKLNEQSIELQGDIAESIEKVKLISERLEVYTDEAQKRDNPQDEK